MNTKRHNKARAALAATTAAAIENPHSSFVSFYGMQIDDVKAANCQVSRSNRLPLIHEVRFHQSTKHYQTVDKSTQSYQL